jgi:alpha-beta hydrolase superfamily lysophospholipase
MNTESESNTNEDVTFYMQGWEPEGKPKAVVCLVHGIGEHTGRYAHVGRAFNDAGYALFGFDMRGHGKSGGPRGHFPSLDVVMQDIRQFVEFQRQNHPGLPVFLYGHSLGGLMTLAFTIQYGQELKGVIATGSALRSALQEQKVKVALAKMLGTIIPRVTISSDLGVEGLSHDQAVMDAYVNDPLTHDKASLGLGKTALTAIDLCFARAREFKPPLLIMHGKADKITYASGSEDFAKLVSETNKDVTLKLWDGLYHEIHNEPEQAEVFKVIIEWIGKRLK